MPYALVLGVVTVGVCNNYLSLNFGDICSLQIRAGPGGWFSITLTTFKLVRIVVIECDAYLPVFKEEREVEEILNGL